MSSVINLPGVQAEDLSNSIEAIAETFIQQAEALNRLARSYDNEEYSRALRYMLDCKGHVIVIGMGKSGHVGRKISATMASTGTPSFFLHPAEAIHGDLGMITEGDVVLLISFSGETNEILQMIPAMKSFGNKIIAITGTPNSTLANHSDVVLEIGVKEESCPNNLVPTTSTTVTIAMGDALAVALMSLREFQAEDFARYHPGGALGRRLLVCAKDVMKSEEVPVVAPNDALIALAAAMAGSKVSVAVVVEDDKPIGVVTKAQIKVALRVTGRPHQVTSRKCMSTTFASVSLEDRMEIVDDVIDKSADNFVVVIDDKGCFQGVYEKD